MVKVKKIASVCNVTKAKPKESNSELNAECASSLVMEGKGEEKLQEESNVKVKAEKEASGNAEEATEKNNENEMEEASKKDIIEADGNGEEKKVDEGIKEVDAKEPNKEKEMEIVKKSREETRNSEGKKRKLTKKTTRLITKKKVAVKHDDKGIVGVEDGEVKKAVEGDEKKEEISVDEQKMEANADEAKKKVTPCKDNKEVNINEKEKQKLQNKESNSELNAECASSLVMEGKGEEKLQEESNVKVKAEKEASGNAEEATEKNNGNEMEEASKKDIIEADGNGEEKKVDEGIKEVDAKEPNKEKEMEMVKKSREETRNSEGKKRKLTKKTTRLITKKKVAVKHDDKGIVGVEDGEVKKAVEGDEKKKEISVDEQKMEANADEAKKKVKPCKDNKEVNINEKEKQKLQNSGKRKREHKVDDSLVSQESKHLKNKENLATENVEMVARNAGDAGKASDSGMKESSGLIFMCNRNTKRDCFKYKVLGLPANKKELVANIYRGMRLFLFDVDHRLMFGIYKAAGPGGYNIEPKAFNSGFPSQVRFKVVSECTPLPEEKFKAAIKDNYVGRKRFNIELTGEQVKKLCKLFTSSRSDDLARKDTGSLGIDKRQGTRVRGRRHQERVRDRRPAASSRRNHEVQMGKSSRFRELPREAEPVRRARGHVREREPVRSRRLSRDSTLMSGVHGLPRENTLVGGVHGLPRENAPVGVHGLPRENTLVGGAHGFSRESFSMAADHMLPRESLLIDGVHRRETGIYDREASDIYTREVYALPHLRTPSYVHEDSLHADLHRRELELERRERRLLELERRQQEVIQYEEPYHYKDPILYDGRLLPHATDYASRHRY